MAVRLKTLANMIETRLLRVKSSKRDEKKNDVWILTSHKRSNSTEEVTQVIKPTEELSLESMCEDLIKE